jgi:lipopolysaccharide/colanic/teichoic acid biosynthesis glycosyltransferase
VQNSEASRVPDPEADVPGTPAGVDASVPVVDLTAVDGGGEPVIDLAGRRSPIELHVVRAASRGLLAASRLQLAAKRAFDVVASLGLLLACLPVLATVAVAVALTSRGPVLYRQERIGKDGRPFRMLKFRSMRLGAHEEREGLRDRNRASGPAFKIPNDPRLTRIGRMIRRFSIDELPQLINVLRGEMSLVGPRPPLPEEVEEYDERQRGRLAVTPGLTCIWQVSGRSDVDFDTWVAMDLEYIETWTLGRDLGIVLRTVPAVLSGRGAY